MSKKNKFKVGDKVKALKNAPYKITRDGWKGIVVKVISDGTALEVKSLKGSSVYHVYSEYFELVKSKNECIVIYRKDNKVIALDKSTGKKGVAKCSPDDKFDFETGAKIAFERLFEEKSQPIYNGKFVVTKTSCMYLTFGKIYKLDNGYFVDDAGNTYPLGNPISDFDDLKEYLSGRKEQKYAGSYHYSSQHTEIIEVVE